MRASLLVILIACSGKDAVDSSLHTGESGEPGSTDLTTCGAFSGFDAKGAEWSYAWTSGATVGEGITTLLDVDATGGSASTSTVLRAESADSTTTITSTVSYVCDADGLWVGAQSTDWETVSAESTRTDWLLTTFDPPWLVLQRDAVEGSSWSGTTHRSAQGSAVDATEADLTYAMNAAVETVSVPAGSYDTLRVDVSGDLGQTSWYSAGVGLVKTGDLQLSAFSL